MSVAGIVFQACSFNCSIALVTDVDWHGVSSSDVACTAYPERARRPRRRRRRHASDRRRSMPAAGAVTDTKRSQPHFVTYAFIGASSVDWARHRPRENEPLARSQEMDRGTTAIKDRAMSRLTPAPSVALGHQRRSRPTGSAMSRLFALNHYFSFIARHRQSKRRRAPNDRVDHRLNGALNGARSRKHRAKRSTRQRALPPHRQATARAPAAAMAPAVRMGARARRRRRRTCARTRPQPPASLFGPRTRRYQRWRATTCVRATACMREGWVPAPMKIRLAPPREPRRGARFVS